MNAATTRLGDFLEDQVPPWWLPEDRALLDDLPRTGVGMLDTKEMRAMLGGRVRP
ncbi:MAG: hypothetical protein H7231_00205 [Rhodoferax sp.]|nr:hypothetical protein [Actinomycetota bacterium]